MNTGQKTTLKVTTTPENITESYELVWKSSNTSVASVDPKGQVTGKKQGSATITVSLKGNDGGVLICGTGIGISLAANKVKGIRAAVCSEPYSAKLSKQHNNSNIIAFGSRVVGVDLAKMIVKEWIEAKFEGGRHLKRVELISKIENGEEI